MHIRTILLIAGGLALFAIVRKSVAERAGLPEIAGVPADPFAQGRFDERMGVVMLLPSFLRVAAALTSGLPVQGNSVVIPRGVSYPAGAPVSAGASLFLLA